MTRSDVRDRKSRTGIILRHPGIAYQETKTEISKYAGRMDIQAMARVAEVGVCIAEAAVAATATKRKRILYGGIRRLEGARTPAVGFSSSFSPTRHVLPILCPATPFIGTPGIIRSEFVFSRPCAVLAVGVSSIRPATDYWTKTRG